VVLAELGTECGYYHQAHPAREFRDLAGCLPSALGRPINRKFRETPAGRAYTQGPKRYPT
jgi:hypothetical protein